LHAIGVYVIEIPNQVGARPRCADRDFIKAPLGGP
jgi:hypothetical protein